MKRTATVLIQRCLRLTAIAGVACTLQAPLVQAQGTQQQNERLLPLEQRAQVDYDAYILGPGDGLQIELLDLPELSGNYSIGPDGTLYLPRLRALYVEGLTVEELRYFLTQQFSTYVREPQLFVRPVVYRPIRIYVGGAVRRPGYYTLSGQTNLSRLSASAESQQLQMGTATEVTRPSLGQVPGGVSANPGSGVSTFGAVFPTVFDAIRTAQGVTPYSDLARVQVTRRRAQGLGGGRIRTNLNFLSLITEGNESQNIRLFDGDVVSVGRSNVVMREQLLKAGQTNLSPQFINVFVSGRVNTPGGVTIPQGSVLNQAIALAGGPRLLKGKVEFVRFTLEGEIDRRTFRYNPGAAADAPNNPVLMAGDLITIQESPLSATVTVLNEISGPVVGIYSVYSLFNGFSQ
ncbi:polysaccharide biosynthesis/export family protein [Synechococcus sp. NOUM97013]|uniref:polysaccharide biosynthesis/export family protein n=1 Tax=Synechococcus sp. NOUM97013 TaxID=1442555 RepID=UPI0016443398|nr:polysaccharide biosynthesis/export family protein [Synechococcus sp. NOUM97013]QNI72316.1 polysaccharide biosynthesis/export family protein [Synechococcus sp. NOUM97013]